MNMPNNGAKTMVTVYINNVVKQMKTDLRLIEEQQPLIHNITNYVAINFVANSLLAIGASPIMARAEEEVEEISSKSNALALNLGIPESATAHSIILTGEVAMERRIPIVFDVVGVGATRFRMDIASQIILRCHPTVIKGNASEIQASYNSAKKTQWSFILWIFLAQNLALICFLMFM